MSFKKQEIENLSSQSASNVSSNNANGTNIKSIKIPTGTDVYDLKPREIQDTKINYSQLKSGFLSQEQNSNSRFQLNELSRGLMSVDEEDEKRIEIEVRRRVKAVLEDFSEKVKKIAYIEGYDQGREDGRVHSLEELQPSIAHIHDLFKSFDSASADIALANEIILTRLVYQISKKVLLREVAEDYDFVKRTVTSIIDKLGTRENIRVLVSRETYKDIEKIKTDILSSISGLKNLSVEQDSSIDGYGCRVETEFGDIDATLNQQLEQISEVLKPLEPS